MTIRVGTAGWSIPKQYAGEFPMTGSMLERYSQCFGLVEINSSFYRPHRRETYERWAASTPDSFGFSVKLPKAITHQRRLRDVTDLLERFLREVGGLGSKLSTILVQLPPSLQFSAELVSDFLGELRLSYSGAVACEPRHRSWFGDEAAAVLNATRVDFAAVDPPPCHGAPEWDAVPNPVYIRLHGAPKIYFSDSPMDVLPKLAERLAAIPSAVAATCIFDNTVASAGPYLEKLFFTSVSACWSTVISPRLGRSRSAIIMITTAIDTAMIALGMRWRVPTSPAP
jgi:uncharacterized protein YecE (DUF72 family)